MKHLFLGLAFSLAAGSAGAATVLNGSFEDPGTFSGAFQTINAGGSALEGWTVESGSVDLINTYWENAVGNYSLDLSGNAAATISQDITGLIIGQAYTLKFMLAGNPDGDPVVKSVRVSMGDDEQTFTFDTTGTTVSAMGWTAQSLSFIAGATTETLRFASLDEGFYGPALDEVSISVIPLPAAAPLLLAGLGALALMRRRARRKAA